MVESLVADIIRFNIRTMTIDTLVNSGRLPLFVSVDEENGLVYWVNYDSDKEVYQLMKTYYSGATMDLNISYPGEIKITQDMFHLYVLDADNSRIDKYKKSSMLKDESITVTTGAKEIIAGYGEFSNKC